MNPAAVPDLLDVDLYGNDRLGVAYSAMLDRDFRYAAHSLWCWPCPGHVRYSEPCAGGWHTDCNGCSCSCSCGCAIVDRKRGVPVQLVGRAA